MRGGNGNQCSCVCAVGIVMLLTAQAAAGDLYGISAGGDVLRLDRTTGAGTFIGNTGTGCNAAAADSQGRIFIVDHPDFLWTVDPVTGAATLFLNLTNRPIPYGVRGLAFDSQDRLYAVMSQASTTVIDILVTIDTVTGQYALIGPTGLTGLQGLAFAPDGTLYAVDVIRDLVRLDAVTGAGTIIGGSGIGGDDQTLEFDDAGVLYAARANLLRVDPTTGAATLIGPTGSADIRGMAFVAGTGGLAGDMNCDGVVDFGDVGPFALALTDPALYALTFPACDIRNGDMNGDGSVNGDDAGGFVAAVLGG